VSLLNQGGEGGTGFCDGSAAFEGSSNRAQEASEALIPAEK